MIDQQLLDILACPLCHGKLSYQQKSQELVCQFHRLAFPIQAGIPILLVDQARELTQQEDEVK